MFCLLCFVCLLAFIKGRIVQTCMFPKTSLVCFNLSDKKSFLSGAIFLRPPCRPLCQVFSIESKKYYLPPESGPQRWHRIFNCFCRKKTLAAPRIWAPDGIFDLFIGLELARLKENRKTTLKREQIVKRFRFVWIDSLSKGSELKSFEMFASILFHCQACLGMEKAPLGEAQKDDAGQSWKYWKSIENEKSPKSILFKPDLKGGGGGAATAVVEAVLVLILIAMSCLAVYLGWRHYKTRCTMEPDWHFYHHHHL